MSNMSYCRFQNTDRDLADCEDTLENMMQGDEPPLSREELAAAKKLVGRCYNILMLCAEFLSVTPEEICEQVDPEVALAEALDIAQEYAVNEQEGR